MTIRWLHIDCKGVLPSLAAMQKWLDFWAALGVNGLVLEYEDRLPWRTWPGTFRPGFSVADWQRLHTAARQRGINIIPLIQTHGHLEWLLKHPRWASWRENGCWNELCPQERDVLPALREWLDEIKDIHGDIAYLHIGGDETWNLATCPACQAVARSSPDGKLAVYLDHLQRVVEQVLQRGMRPLIWADAFWREHRLDLVARLPGEVVLCDWQYDGTGPWPTAQQLGAAGHLVLGCSAVRCGYDLSQGLDRQQPRVANVRAWQRHEHIGGVIHTTWSRTRSLLAMYGPWEGWLPAFAAIAEPDRWPQHPLHDWVERLDSAMTGSHKAAAALADELHAARFDDEWSSACVRWWALALRWRAILLQATGNAQTFAALRAVHQHVGVDPDFINHRRTANQRLLAQADDWQRDVRAFFIDRQLSDVEEFLASRLNMLQAAWPQDWAVDVVPIAPPRSAR